MLCPNKLQAIRSTLKEFGFALAIRRGGQYTTYRSRPMIPQNNFVETIEWDRALREALPRSPRTRRCSRTKPPHRSSLRAGRTNARYCLRTKSTPTGRNVRYASVCKISTGTLERAPPEQPYASCTAKLVPSRPNAGFAAPCARATIMLYPINCLFVI